MSNNNVERDQFNIEFGNKIKSLRKGLKMSRASLGEKMGKMHETTIKKYEDGNIKEISRSRVMEFAKALDTTVEFLMGWESRQVTSKDLEKIEPNAFRKMINVYSRVPAGDPKAVEQYVEGFEVTDDYRVDYALKVYGDSMINAGIFNGSIVYVQKDADYNNGDIVIAIVCEMNATIKRFYRYGDKVILKPENPSMKETEYNVRDIELIGKVLYAKVFF